MMAAIVVIPDEELRRHAATHLPAQRDNTTTTFCSVLLLFLPACPLIRYSTTLKGLCYSDALILPPNQMRCQLKWALYHSRHRPNWRRKQLKKRPKPRLKQMRKRKGNRRVFIYFSPLLSQPNRKCDMINTPPMQSTPRFGAGVVLNMTLFVRRCSRRLVTHSRSFNLKTSC
jgi:hypothetical protein